MATPDYTSDNPADRLAAVRAAIAKSLLALEYKVGKDAEVTRNSVKDLRALEKDLQQEVAAQSGGIDFLLGSVERSP